jgi:hypothetical protein
MKRIGEIRQIVLDYATSQPIFISPTAINEPIVPQPESMSDSMFGRFFSSLHGALADAEVLTHVRLGELRAVDTWADLAAIIFGRQVA